MTQVPVRIVRFINDHQPGWVAAELHDAFGEVQTFEDKVPFFYDGYLDRNSSYPQPGEMWCHLLHRWTSEDGRELALIETEPSSLGEDRFTVSAEQVITAKVTNSSLQDLKNCHFMSLWLDGTQVTDAGLIHIQRMTDLRVLSLNFTDVTDVGLKDLGNLSQLRRLCLSGSKVTNEGVEKLQQVLPKCKIEWEWPTCYGRADR
jgi:hypothetical protein